MKVLDLRCAHGHGFEGWFDSEDDFLEQNGRSLIECPLCADRVIQRMPSAPRLNLSGTREAGPPQAEAKAADLQAAWLAGMRELISRTEDVGPRFAEEARRIHYGETEARHIRGQATPEERQALAEEGIETVMLPVPRGFDGPVQ